jgi:hypothetical protein
MALYRACDEVLHYVWDPIGIATLVMARDEYHGYLPVVFGMVRDGYDENVIAAYLTRVVTERMGLPKNDEHTMNVARLLLAWEEKINKQYAD